MSMRVFDPTQLEQRFKADAFSALRLLAEAVDVGALQVVWRSTMPIAGGPRDEFDTFRLTVDVNVRLVQPVIDQPATACNGLQASEAVKDCHQLADAPRRRLRAGSVSADGK